MKKKSIIATMLIVTLVSGISVYKVKNSQSFAINMTLAKMEAFAQGEDGTNVRTCYKEKGYDFESTKFLKCASGTSTTVIYPCSSATWEDGTGANSSLCTE